MGRSGKIILWVALIATLDLLFPFSWLFRPAIGAGIAALLVSGRGLWPGVFMGSAVGGLLEQHSLPHLAAQAALDTLHALFACYLVQRSLGLPTPLIRTREQIRFCLLVGPAASVPASALAYLPYLAGSPSWPYQPIALILFCWISTALGAGLATPLLLCLFDSRFPWRRRRASVALPTLCLLMLATFGRLIVQRQVDRLELLQAKQQADAMLASIGATIEPYSDLCSALGGLFRASDQVTEAEFRGFLDDLTMRGKTVDQVAWIPSGPPRSDRAQPFVYGAILPDQSSPADLLALPAVKSALAQSARTATAVMAFPSSELEDDGEALTLLAVGDGAALVRWSFPSILRSVVQGRSDPNQEVELLVQVRQAEHTLTALQSPLTSAGPSPTVQADSSRSFAGLTWTVTCRTRGESDWPRTGLPLSLLAISVMQLYFLRLSSQTMRIELLKRDIEERAESLRELNLELESAVSQARRADQAKGLFLANMSHEIRTPMNGILGLTRLVLEAETRPAQREQLRHVEASGEALLRLLNDILDTSRIEMGDLALDLRPTSLERLIEPLVRSLGLAAEAKGLEVNFLLADGVPDRVIADETRLQQVLMNLLGNAIKFTPTGGIDLRVESAPGGKLRFSVRDTGIGVPEGRQEAIFEPFTQVENGQQVSRGGTGLGLSISRHLVRLMGGELRLQSREGQGAVFSFTIACPEVDERPAGAAEPSTVLDASVYLGVSHPSRRSVAQSLLQQVGLSLVDSPGEATLRLVDVDLLEEAGGPEAPRTIALLEVSKLGPLLEECYRRGAVPLVLPLSRRGLGVALDEALGEGSLDLEGARQRAGSSSCLNPTYAGRSALVADDNWTNRLVATLLLERMGFRVESFENGEKVVEAVRQRTYDLLLLDLQMPGLDGFETARAVRALGCRAPIVAATAHLQEAQERKAAESGMDAFLCKPLTDERLREAVRAAWKGEAETPVWRESVLLQTVGGQGAAARAVVNSFLHEAPLLMAGLREASSKDEIALAGHRFRGAAETFGASALVALLDGLEELQAPASEQRRGEALERVQSALESLQAALQTFLERG